MPKTRKQTLKVTGSNLLIEPLLESEEVGGLVRSVQYEDKAYKGRVLMAGKECDTIKEGDTVYFNKYSSTVFPFEGKELLTLKEVDVIAYE